MPALIPQGRTVFARRYDRGDDMNEQELRSLVERMVLELAGQPAGGGKTAPEASTAPAADVDPAGCLEDITETDLRRQYLV